MNSPVTVAMASAGANVTATASAGANVTATALAGANGTAALAGMRRTFYYNINYYNMFYLASSYTCSTGKSTPLQCYR